MRRKHSTSTDGGIIQRAGSGALQRKFRTPRHGRGLLQVGNPGRRPNKWRQFCAWLVEQPAVLQSIEEALTRKGGPLRFPDLFKLVVEQGHGRARQQVELSGPESGRVPVEVVRAELLRKIVGAQASPAVAVPQPAPRSG